MSLLILSIILVLVLGMLSISLLARRIVSHQ